MQHTILIVDDELVHLENLIEAIKKTDQNYKVLRSLDAEMALKIISKEIPDLIITDWDMPGISGIEMIKKIKSQPAFQNIPVIMCTGIMLTSQHLKTALDAGANDYIRKPVDHVELHARINSLLRFAESQKKMVISDERYNQLIDKAKNAEKKSQNFINELAVAKEQAEESDRLKTAFLNNISHEIRTPLNAINGFSQLLTNPKITPEKLKTYSQIISSHSDKLVEIITNVIEVSEIQARKIKANLAELDIISLINNISFKYAKEAKEKNIEFVLNNNIPEKEFFIFSDFEKIKKILTQLIDNGLKFTHQGKVEIKMELVNENLQITINDTGIGIADKMQKFIFEPFRQLETGINRTYGGNGLGLSLVKTYTELLQGQISLHSEINKGTTFTLTFPANSADQNIRPNTIADQKYAVNTILIAEDQMSNFKYLCDILESTKINILHAINGQQALDLCRANAAIDLILMDIEMPVMDGHTATKLIKAFRPSVPIIAQTAHALESEREKYQNIFDDYITKPIDKADLDKKLIKYM